MTLFGYERLPRGARRSIRRLAARNVRRDWKRSVAVAALVSVGVAAGGVTAVVARSLDGGNDYLRAEFGNASYVHQFGSRWDQAARNPAEVVAEAEAYARAAFPDASDALIVRSTWISDDSQDLRDLSRVWVHAYDPSHPLADFADVLDGRMATAPDHIAVSWELAEIFDVGVGQVITLPGSDPLTVTGVYRGAESRADVQVTDLPVSEHVEGAYLFRILSDEPMVLAAAERDLAVEFQDHGWTSNRDDYRRANLLYLATVDLSYVSLGVMAAVLGLVVSGAVAAAAMSSGVGRRLRQVGILAAGAGADDRHLRRMVTTEAVWLGLAGSAAGVGLSLVFGVAVTAVLARDESVGAFYFDWRWFDLAGPALAGVVGLIIAARHPARVAGRVPPVMALGGRVPPPVPQSWPIRVVRVGTVVFVLGALAQIVLRDGRYLTAAIGSFATIAVLGAVSIVAVPAVAALGRRFRQLPTTARLVVRDAERHPVRSATAVLVLVSIFAAGVLALSIVRYEGVTASSATPAGTVVISGPRSSVGTGSLASGVATEIADTIPSSRQVAFRTITGLKGSSLPVGVGSTDALIAAGIEGTRTTVAEMPAYRLVDRFDAMPSVFIDVADFDESEHEIQSAFGWILVSSAELAGETSTIESLRAYQADTRAAWVWINEPNTGAPSWVQRALIAVAFGLVVLAVLTIVVVLGSAETEEDASVMRALGGDPATRKRHVAGSALTLGAVGAVAGLGVALGLLRSISPFMDVSYPWPQILGFVLVVPVVGALTMLVVIRRDHEMILPRQ